MKKILMTGLVLGTSLIAFSQTILIGFEGESNWVSRAKADARFEMPTTPGAYWYKQSTNTLEPVTDPIGEGISRADDRSAAPAFAKRLKELLPSYNIIIVPSAVGGSTIRQWSKGQPLYERAKTMWEAAINYCNTHGITLSKKYVAWEQGGNDVGTIETDGYYYYLNQLTNDFLSDFGAEKVFGVRIGYDPNYASAADVEKVMKAHKLVNFNHPNYVLSSNAPATFNWPDETMQGDLVHWTLKGINIVGNEVAEAVHLYQTTSQKPTLPEPVTALQSVTTGDINLTPDWNFQFNGNVLEAQGNALMRQIERDNIRTTVAIAYTPEGVAIPLHYGLMLSRPFSYNTFTIEMRVKLNANNRSMTVLNYDQSAQYNKLVILPSAGNPILEFGTATRFFSFDLPGIDFLNYHTVKLTQKGGVLSLYVDDVPKGTRSSSEAFTMQYLGLGAYGGSDMDGSFDYFKIKNAVDNVPLPVRFKSFKATNIK